MRGYSNDQTYPAIVIGSGYDGLYVSDGSIVPTALGVNPSKTIAAPAERDVEHLLEGRSP